MTCTLCQGAALDRILAFFAIVVAAILTIPALRPGLSRPMMPKPGFLPPAASALPALPRKRRPEFERAVLMALDVPLSARNEVPAAADGDDWITKSLRQRILKGYESY